MTCRGVLTFTTGVLALIMGSGASAQAMSAYLWKQRPLLVFASHDGAADLMRQKAIVESARAGFAERDIVVVYVVGDAVAAVGGAAPGQTASKLRARYGVEPGRFRAVLVGKDGGAKLSASAPLTAQRLFATIDAMPMRIDEMRRQR